jgi:hypothetical protein
MMMILSKIPQILGNLVHFFHKNPLYQCHWISFGLPMAKIHQNKLLFISLNSGVSILASNTSDSEI